MNTPEQSAGLLLVWLGSGVCLGSIMVFVLALQFASYLARRDERRNNKIWRYKK